jgi:hypothetical protein
MSAQEDLSVRMFQRIHEQATTPPGSLGEWEDTSVLLPSESGPDALRPPPFGQGSSVWCTPLALVLVLLFGGSVVVGSAVVSTWSDNAKSARKEASEEQRDCPVVHSDFDRSASTSSGSESGQVPEPSTLVMLGILGAGGVSAGLWRRRRRRKGASEE